jgi:hypothetical protein
VIDMPEEQPTPFATSIDEKAVIWALMHKLRMEGTTITGEMMREARLHEVMIQKQQNGGVFVAVE